MQQTHLLKECPICERLFPEGDALRKHVDLCLRNENIQHELTDEETKCSRLNITDVTLDLKNSNFNAIPRSLSIENDENVHSIFSKKDLDCMISDLKKLLRKMRFNIRKADIKFHIEANDSYQKIDKELKRFCSGLNSLRKNFGLVKNDNNDQNSEMNECVFNNAELSNSKPSLSVDLPNNGTNVAENEENNINFSNFQNDKITNSNTFNLKQSLFVDDDQKMYNDDGLKSILAQLSLCNVCNEGSDPEKLMETDCDHRICLLCANKYITNGVNEKRFEKEQLICPVDSCERLLPQWIINTSIKSKNVLESLASQQTQFVINSTKSICQCPKCGQCFEKVAGTVQKLNENESNEFAMSMEARIHRAENRYRCQKCYIEQCASCQTIPYHNGKTCDQFKAYVSAKKCRYCQNEIKSKSNENCCNDRECKQKYSNSCRKIKKCGHICGGVIDEKECLPCLKKGCNDELDLPNANDYCQICYVEALDQAPTIKLNCGHFFHYHCIKSQIDRKQPGSRILFGFCKCPLCKKFLSNESISPDLKIHLKLYATIKQKAFERLKIECLEDDKRIKDPNGKYFNNPYSFAMDRFAFYICYKCKQPYFGGMRRCEDAANEAEEKFDLTELICGSCSSGPDASNCKLHGTEYITYKCKFCCNIANQYCWGTTHFCDICHKKQEKRDYVSRKPKSQLPKCLGKESCPLRIDHPPNGEEFSLGCFICLRK